VSVEVHPVRPEEIEALSRLTYAAYAALDHPLDDGYAAELRDVRSRAAEADVLVAVDGDGSLVGGVTYVPDRHNRFAEFDGDDMAGFRMLAVDPSGQGRGVGQTLVEACVARARAAGKAHLVLHTTPWMTVAHRLYERLGFCRAPELDAYPEIPLWGYSLEL
jgi:ribosomal protein S18 acetylase RimI-like enzyme